MSSRFALRSVILGALAAAIGACGLSVIGDAPPGSDAGVQVGTIDSGGAPGANDGAPGDPPPVDEGGAPDAPAPSVSVYVNTTTSLHRVDGTTGEATPLFTFGGSCAGINVGDIAIDRTGAMFAVSLPPGNQDSELYRVDRATGACGPSLGNLGLRCSALTFAPDPSDASKDVLYAGCTASLCRIDATTGEIDSVGQFGSGLTVSGDIVWFPGHGLFATLTTGAGNDRVSRIDIASGAATTIAPDSGAAALFGLAYHGSRLIAFGNPGARTIDPVSGATAPFPSQLLAYGAATGL